MIILSVRRSIISPWYWIFVSPSEFNLLTVIIDLAPGQSQDSVHYFRSNLQIFHITEELSMTRERMSTHASYSHLARKSDVLQVYSPSQNRESLMPRMCPSRYLDRGFEKDLQHGCHQLRSDYMRGD